VKDYITERVILLAEYMIEYRATVRQTAKHFGISKSTVHMDLVERLPEINRHMSEEVKAILDENKAERHLRGGEATRKKYMDKSHNTIYKD